ncbi:MAG: ABC transporter substrate-binding protein [Kiritimatiellae bacterium]|nr:ABC transporter substrate-binding protein [Kiritimatiellia bacterium]
MNGLRGEQQDRRRWAGIAAGAVVIAATGLVLSRCDNSPHPPEEEGTATLYFAVGAPFNKLDPATSYYSHEAEVVDNVYEPPFEYHHLRRPYQLQPLAAAEMPSPVFRAADGRVLEGDPPPEDVARVEYTIRIRPGMFYADHPCFATNAAGEPMYRGVRARDVRRWRTPCDFPVLGTREVVAADYVRGLRRLADPRLPCPVYATFKRAILGFGEYSDALARELAAERARRAAEGAGEDEDRRPIVLDYLATPCAGIEVIDRYTFRLVLARKYPQILYWLAMHFAAPIPEEALRFYAEPAIAARQMDLNRWPVGSGPFFVRHCDPDRRIVLQRNPRYRGGVYPSDGAPGDREAGLLDDAGRPIPFLDRVAIVVERESIPAWNKFLQGYYDYTYVTPEVFEQTIQMSGSGEAILSDRMRARGIRLHSSVAAAIYWVGFNMADPVIGGLNERAAALRRAISTALDYNEYLDIFFNGQGRSAQGPIPPGIFGALEGEAGVNRWTDRWDPVGRRPVRRPIEEARQWMAQAGWPDGRGPDGRPLVLHLDHALAGEPSFVAVFEWMRGRLRQLGVELRERGTDLSRYRDKLERGHFQLFRQGWFADYPDPENFLFLFYGPNAKLRSGGANICNYENPEYDRLFERMEGMRDGPERAAMVSNMVEILRRDAPMCWGFHPTFYVLSHSWHRNGKPREMTHNTLKYQRVDAAERARRRREWNRPVVAPVLALEAAALAIAAMLIRRRPPGAETAGC